MTQERARYGGSRPPVTFFVSGCPRPKQSFRYSRHGGGYTPAIVKAWQNEVAWAAKQEMIGDDMLTGELYVSMTFMLPDRRKRDLDNLSKGVLDAMNGIVFEDDRHVVELHLRKQYSKEYPGVRVKVAQKG